MWTGLVGHIEWPQIMTSSLLAAAVLGFLLGNRVRVLGLVAGATIVALTGFAVALGDGEASLWRALGVGASAVVTFEAAALLVMLARHLSIRTADARQIPQSTISTPIRKRRVSPGLRLRRPGFSVNAPEKVSGSA